MKRAGGIKRAGKAGGELRANSRGEIRSAGRGRIARHTPAYTKLVLKDAFVGWCLGRHKIAQVDRGGGCGSVGSRGKCVCESMSRDDWVCDDEMVTCLSHADNVV